MKLVDLKRSKADMKADAAVNSIDQDPYPYGTRIQLDGDELDKLGIKGLAEVGDEFHILAVGKVVDVNASASEGSGERRGMSIQITMMSLSKEAPHAGEMKESTLMEGKEFKGAKSVMSSAYRGKA